MDFLHTAFPLLNIEFSYSMRLVVAAVLGMLLGLDRSLAGKRAGMRTYALVSLGSALFVVVGTLASFQLSMFPGINPLQIAGSIVIGIGFIGSGLAVSRADRPAELTTASGIWVAAGVGMAAGFGLYVFAAATLILSVVVFSVFSKIEYRIQSRWGVEVKQ